MYIDKKHSRLKEEKEELVSQRMALEAKINEINNTIRDKESEISHCYQEFFDSKTNKEFVLYERFPSREVVNSSSVRCFPLYSFGEFQTTELAEMIKQLYSFERQKEYEILTLGLVEKDSTKDHGWEFERLIPRLYFLVGNEKTLAPFKHYENQFINEDFLQSSIEDRCKKDFVTIEVERYGRKAEDVLPMECFTGELTDKKGKINYQNYLRYASNYVDTRESCTFSNTSQIFQSRLFTQDYKGIHSLLKYNFVTSDAILAKILVSICIYKRNNGITELTSDDYNHIFEVLYGEKVDIKGLAEKDITRSLTYVPNSKYGI